MLILNPYTDGTTRMTSFDLSERIEAAVLLHRISFDSPDWSDELGNGWRMMMKLMTSILIIRTEKFDVNGTWEELWGKELKKKHWKSNLSQP